MLGEIVEHKQYIPLINLNKYLIHYDQLKGFLKSYIYRRQQMNKGELTHTPTALFSHYDENYTQ